MIDVKVHPRVTVRHPEITEEDAIVAWKSAIASIRRETSEKDFLLAVGFDRNARLIETIATEDDQGTVFIFHAMTPPSIKMLREVGLVK